MLVSLGAFGLMQWAYPSFAARIRLGPLEVDTDDLNKPAAPAEDTEGEQLKSGQVEVEVQTGEEEPATPHELVSESPKKFPFAPDNKRLVYHARLTDVVDLGLAPFLERVIEEATDDGAAAIIIEIDTPGGRVDAAVQIKDMLLRSKIPTIAFINKQAISAGALIAFAHDYIIWSTGATMGAATPIQMGGGAQAEPVEEKMTSYMRGVMRATAEAKARDPFVAECMVDADLDLPPFAQKGKLLTATFAEGEKLGLVDGKAESFEEVLDLTGLTGARIVHPRENWAEKIARFLTHPITSSVLMTIGMLGIIIEFYTPGFGIAGIAGVIALFLFFTGHLIVNLAGMEELLLLIAGGILIVIEVLLIPGFGIPGIVGVLLIGLSLVLALIGLDIGQLDIAWSEGLLARAVLQFSVSVILAGMAFFLSMRFLPSVAPVRRLILFHRLDSKEGYVASDPLMRTTLPGATGKALTDLRPGGKALINGKKYDVSAYNEYIARGEEIVVLSADGPRITVERLTRDDGEDDAV